MLSIIVAYDETKAIGKDNQLLWHIKEDLTFFKQTTIDHTIVMGRKTYDSIGRPLPRRKTIVLSRQNLQIEGVVVETFETFLEKYKDTTEEIFICGGADIYQLILPYVDKMYISHVTGEHEADVFFPTWDQSLFTCTKEVVLAENVIMKQYERNK